MRKLKVAVIGVGIQGENHVKAYRSNPLSELIAICDINERRLKEVGEKYRVVKRYLDYNEMLEEEELDLVSVATPDHLHLDPVLAVVSRGINVLVEKPMATKYEDALKMVNEAKSKGARVFVNFGNRFNPPFALLKEEVSKGALGELVYAYLRLSDTIYVPTKMLSWASRTSVVYFLMSHTADLARWILGSEVKRVRAYASFKVLKSLRMDIPDHVLAVLDFQNGSRGVLESSWILPESYPSIVEFKAEFIGTKGYALIDSTQQGLHIASETFSYPRFLSSSEINQRFFGFVRESISHIVESLVEGREPIISEEDGLRNVRILDAITRSYKEGKEIIIS